MKKTKLLTSLAALALVLGLGACGEVEDAGDVGSTGDETGIVDSGSHIHEYEVTDSKDATCLDDGYITYTCKDGDDTYTVTIDALGHDWGEWETSVASDCLTDGKEVRSCSRCEATEERTVEATGHSWSEWEETTPATCTQAGEKTRTCSKCGETESSEIAALGGEHQFSNPGIGYLVEETDEHVGTVEYEGTCDICGSHICEGVTLNFASDDWSTIGGYSANGTAKERYVIGETRVMKLAGEEITLRVIDFDHDDTATTSVDYNNGTNKAGITIETVTLLPSTYSMNPSDTYEGGWHSSKLRSGALAADDGFAELMDDDEWDLYEVMQAVYAPANKGSTDINSLTEDYFFPLSVANIFSASAIESTYWEPVSNYASTLTQEGTQYRYYEHEIGDLDPYYSDNCEALQKYQPNSSEAHNYWLRSACLYATTTPSFFTISTIGGLSWSVASNDSCGVSFAFCI